MIGVIDADTEDFVGIGYRRSKVHRRYLKHTWCIRIVVSIKCLVGLFENLTHGCGPGSKQLPRRQLWEIIVPEGRNIHPATLVDHTGTPALLRGTVSSVTDQLHEHVPHRC